jgi:NAD(P)-dependent dehydrogenase (short-subunit alcohol dehydrogenase family)
VTSSPLSRFDLTDRVAIVTGAAGLLGPQHARALLEAGARLVISDVNEVALHATQRQLAAEFGEARISAVTLDVTDATSVSAARDYVLRHCSRLDILLNNAAIDPKMRSDGALREMSRFETFAPEQWALEVGVGLTGAFLCCQCFGGWMASNGGGVILNIASDLSVIAPDQRLYRRDDRPDDDQPVKPVTYSVIKTGLLGLTRYLATYWAGQGVRVNALSPGGVFAGQPEQFVRRLTQLIPMGRMADVAEYRATVQYLCSDASAYMTGQNIVIDGGRSVW